MQKPVSCVLFAVTLGAVWPGNGPPAFWLGIAAIAVRFETAGFANLGGRQYLADSFGGALGLLVVLLRPWA